MPYSPFRGDDLLMIVRRVEALGRFLDTEDGANLLIGTKRAINILRIEEKKDGKSYAQPPTPSCSNWPRKRRWLKPSMKPSATPRQRSRKRISQPP